MKGGRLACADEELLCKGKNSWPRLYLDMIISCVSIDQLEVVVKTKLQAKLEDGGPEGMDRICQCLHHIRYLAAKARSVKIVSHLSYN